ncbi:MAG TPA: beta-N-acetylhexosaminidase family protein, partial [Gemmatimonadales bacterium]
MNWSASQPVCWSAGLLLALTSSVIAAQQPETRHLMPVPQSVAWVPGRVAIDSTFSVAVVGVKDARLARAVDRALRRLEGRTGITFVRETAPRDSNTATVVVRANTAGMAVQGVEEDESYTLNVVGDQARLAAPTVVGALHGLETLLQLVEA